MFGIVFDYLVLMVLLKIIEDEDNSFLTFIVACVASIGGTILMVVLVPPLGLAGIAVAAIVVAALLGVALTLLFGVEIKRAFAIAGMFMVANLAFRAAMQSMFSV